MDASFLMNEFGGSGETSAIGIMAIPTDETMELPMSLIAVTLVEIGSESPIKKGDCRNTAVGIVQLLPLIMTESFSASQFDSCFSKLPVDVMISSR